MTTILCHDASGGTFPVAPEALFFRPAVYGIFIENSQVLLHKHPQTMLWQPPGTVLAENETPTQAVRHVFRRLTGMTPRVGAMLYVEDQYVLDSDRGAWQLSVVYYALERPSTAATISDTSKVEWVPLGELERSQMQFGYEAVQAGRLQLKL
ncbi:MAG: NUDIX domain-containing protein [Anaerolineae bacterium]|nr:NUDIX domain-containing protein [Anaerolineae bacterium]